MERKDRGPYSPLSPEERSPLSRRESEAMGRQTDPDLPGEDQGNEVVYGEIDNSPENEDQRDAHRAEPDEHV